MEPYRWEFNISAVLLASTLFLLVFPQTSYAQSKDMSVTQVFSMDGVNVSQPTGLPVSIRRIWHDPDASKTPNYFVEVQNTGSKQITCLTYMAGHPGCWKPSERETTYGVEMEGALVYWGNTTLLANYGADLGAIGWPIERGQVVVLTAPGETVAGLFREVPKNCDDPHVNLTFDSIVYSDGSGWIKDQDKVRPLERSDKEPPFEVTTIEFSTGHGKLVQIKEWDLNYKDGLNIQVGFKGARKGSYSGGYKVMAKMESLWAPRNLYRNNLDMILKYNSWANIEPVFPMQVGEVPYMENGKEDHTLLENIPVSPVLLKNLEGEDTLWCWAVLARVFVYDFEGRKILETSKVLPIKRDGHFEKLRNVPQPDHFEPDLP